MVQHFISKTNGLFSFKINRAEVHEIVYRLLSIPFTHVGLGCKTTGGEALTVGSKRQYLLAAETAINRSAAAVAWTGGIVLCSANNLLVTA